MKKISIKKLLFVFVLFLFFLMINTKPSSARYVEEVVNPILITDTALYNYDYIQGCIDSGQSPIDAAKNILDEYHAKYPDDILCSSSDLPLNAFVVRSENVDTSLEKTYHFYIVFNNGIPKKQTYGSQIEEVNMKLFAEKYDDGSFSESCDFYYLRFSENGFSFSGEDICRYTEDSVIFFEFPKAYNHYGYAELIASNFDIYCSDTGELVFQPPTLKEATTLAPVIQREKTKGTLQVAMMEIIQILPLIILVLVSFLGLRKALKMLFVVLRRS